MSLNKIVIAIATYKRPRMLEVALQAVSELRITDAEVSVLVADNDAVHKDGFSVVERLSSTYRFPITAICVADRGISQVRNALVDIALHEIRADFLAFMDDDQRPEAEWLLRLMTMQNATNADVVASAVYPEFEIAPPAWLGQSGSYRRDTHTNGRVNVVYGIGGVLLSAKLAARVPLPWFDPSFSQTGGEDHDFFLRVSAAGGRFARAAKSVIHERYPASRTSMRWALQRAYRGGNGYVLIAKRQSSFIGLLMRECIKIPVAMLICLIGILLALGRPTLQFNLLLRFTVALGKAAALIKHPYQEYAVTHGK